MNGLYAPTSLEGTDDELNRLWEQMTLEIKAIDPQKENWKIQNLPLARVKKIMKAEEFVIQELEKDRLRAEDKSDDDVSKHKLMIAADAPVLLSRACELLVRELTCRAWRHTERNRRRTLQRQDIHAAVGESEVYDFLIDIVPRVAPASRTQQQVQQPQVQHGFVPQMGIGAIAATNGDPALLSRQPQSEGTIFHIKQEEPQQQQIAVEDEQRLINQEQQPNEEQGWDESEATATTNFYG